MLNQLTKFRDLLTMVIASCMIVLLFATSVLAQGPYTRKKSFMRSDLPPGINADIKRMSNPELNFHVQPVRMIVPAMSRIQLASQGAFIPTNSSRSTIGLTVGPVYRFKITDIDQHWGVSLYPSLEILEKLNPPEGLENQFPIQVVITQDDLEQAIEGRMVTKVIYLENPEIALPHRHNEDQQPYFDVGGGEDPLRAAERLGRPMAILRIGSRIPVNTDDDMGFDFYSPAPVMLPDPNPVDVQQNWDNVEGEVMQGRVFEGEILNVPPIRVPNRDAGMSPRGMVPRATPMQQRTVIPGEVLDAPQQAPERFVPPIVPGEIIRENGGR